MRSGFSLLEVLIVVFIIGLMASMVVPRLMRRAPDTEWSTVHTELSTMLSFAKQEAIVTQKVHRLTFNKKQETISVEVDAGEGKPGQRIYEPVTSLYYPAQYELPPGLSLVSLLYRKKSLFEEHKGMGWCYVTPNGLVQDVVLTLERVEPQGVATRKKFKVAPFLGVFESE